MRIRGERFLERDYTPFYGGSVALSPGESGVLLKPSGALEEPQLITVHLSATLAGIDVLPGLITGRLGARLLWGTGATSHEAWCDVARGLCLSLVASALDVGVYYVAGSGPRVEVHGSLSYGQRPSPTYAPGPTFTDGPFRFDNVTPLVSRIPPFARSATLLLDAQPAITLTERMTSDLAGSIFTTRDLALATGYPSPLSVPSFANFYRVTSPVPGTLNAWVLYELAL